MGCYRKEPELNDLLADPIVQAVMDRDSVEELELRRLIDKVRLSMGAESTEAASCGNKAAGE
jgi:hypothetical protein